MASVRDPRGYALWQSPVWRAAKVTGSRSRVTLGAGEVATGQAWDPAHAGRARGGRRARRGGPARLRHRSLALVRPLLRRPGARGSLVARARAGAARRPHRRSRLVRGGSLGPPGRADAQPDVELDDASSDADRD